MEISKIKNHLLCYLTPFASKHGLKVVKSRFCLKREDENNEFQFSFDYNSWGDEIHLFPYVQIKNKIIHHVCKVNGFHLNYTAFINLLILNKIYNGDYTDDTKWEMQYNRQDRFVIFNENNLKNAEQRMEKLLPIGLNYLESYANIYAIDKMYNIPPLDRQNPNCSGLDTQCIIGLISAKISNNVNYDNICEQYSDLIHSNDLLPATVSKFDSIKEYLNKL